MSDDQLTLKITNAISAHGAWKSKLKAAVNVGHSEFTPNDVRCNNKCDFGKWLHGPSVKDEIRIGTPYRVISRLHTEFHKCAGEVLELATTGRHVEAVQLLDGEFTQQSDKLVRGLHKWQDEVA